MQPIIIQSSRAKWLRYLAGSLMFVATGVWLVVMDASSVSGWASILFFAFTAAVFMRQLADRRPRITIDDKGIVDRTLRLGLIEWDDIDGAYLKKMRGASFICLRLRDTNKYIGRLPRRMQRVVAFNEKLGATPVSLNFTGVQNDPQEVVDLIDQQIRARWEARFAT